MPSERNPHSEGGPPRKKRSQMKPAEAEIQAANEALVASAKRAGKQGNLTMDSAGRMVLLDEAAGGFAAAAATSFGQVHFVVSSAK